MTERLRQFECDPIAGMVTLARDEAVPVALRARLFMELATYVAPRCKAIDLTGKAGAPLDLGDTFNTAALTYQELETLLALLNKAEVIDPS